MDMNVTNEDGRIMIKLSGYLDTTASPALQKCVEDLSAETYGKEGPHLVFDIEELEFISSSGLRVLLLATKMATRLGGSMELRNVKESIREVLDMTGFSTIFKLK
jgi:anti-anti-sigma factor